MKTPVKINPKKIALCKKRVQDKTYMDNAINEIASVILQRVID